MKRNPFKIILTLLLLCVVFILALQAYWISSFYYLKKEEFRSNVFQAMEHISEKLRERQNLNTLIHEIVVDRDDTVFNNGNEISVVQKKRFGGNVQIAKKFSFTSDSGAIQKTRVSVNDSTVIYSVQIDPKIERKILNKNIEEDNVLNISATDSGKKGLKIRKLRFTGASVPQTMERIDEMTKLITKMESEIRLESLVELPADTVSAIIERSLKSKGITNDFEYSIRNFKKQKKDEILMQSAGFNPEQFFYQGDLSTNKVFSSGDYLWLQFPGLNQFVLTGIRGSLTLSLFFSVLMLGLFYYTIKLILNQKKISELKNDFVNNMTHELKTPIATISLAIDAMTNPKIKNDEQKFDEYSRIVKEENQKLNHHVERVLQMSLLEKGNMELVKSNINLVDLLKNTMKNYALQIEETKAVVSLHSKKDRVVISADSVHLAAVFNNLLDNALKYSKENCKIEIIIQDENNNINVIFKDNGIGIDAENKDKIFEKFYRVQGGDLHDIKGFGLGLSYVKSIIEAHGGTIDIKSEKGTGTEFIICLNCSI